MNKIFKMLFHRNNGLKDNDCGFTITGGLPQPIRNVKYNDQLRVLKTLGNLPTGGSFPIPNELDYTVRRMRDVYYPEYKIIIRNMGTSKRVFRVA